MIQHPISSYWVGQYLIVSFVQISRVGEAVLRIAGTGSHAKCMRINKCLSWSVPVQVVSAWGRSTHDPVCSRLVFSEEELCAFRGMFRRIELTAHIGRSDVELGKVPPDRQSTALPQHGGYGGGCKQITARGSGMGEEDLRSRNLDIIRCLDICHSLKRPFWDNLSSVFLTISAIHLPSRRLPFE
jgi:hypothetical protein